MKNNKNPQIKRERKVVIMMREKNKFRENYTEITLLQHSNRAIKPQQQAARSNLSRKISTKLLFQEIMQSN